MINWILEFYYNLQNHLTLLVLISVIWFILFLHDARTCFKRDGHTHDASIFYAPLKMTVITFTFIEAVSYLLIQLLGAL